MHLHQQLPSIPIIINNKLEAENMPEQLADGRSDIIRIVCTVLLIWYPVNVFDCEIYNTYLVL